MNLELILALIGGIVVVLGVVSGLILAVTTVWGRIRRGQWWWDEAADGLESGQ